jgi:hypothetical protein
MIRELQQARVSIFSAVLLLFMSTTATGGDGGGKQPLILAHYMPWYGAKPTSDQWGWHWTMNHFDPEQQSEGRREIASQYYPLIGPYDSGDPHVLEYHLLTMKLAGIDGVIVDWYGLTDFRDYGILHRNTTRLLQQCERLNMKFVICYEDQTVPALVKGNRIKPSARVPHVAGELNWLGKYWFKSLSYVRIDGKPVMLSFGHAGLTNQEWSQVLKQLDQPVLYYSQGYRREGAVGGFGWPVPQEGLPHNDRFLEASAQWPDAIAVAFPRFVDIYREAAVSDGYPQIADRGGATFQTTLSQAIKSKSRIIQIATWNDWGEGTQIEPSREFGYRDLEAVLSASRGAAGADLKSQFDAMRLPYEIMLRRRSGSSEWKHLDQAVQQLLKGNRENAKRLLLK